MQLQHQAEELLPAGITHQFAGVRVEDAHGAATLARRRGEEGTGGKVAVDVDREHRDFKASGSFDFRHQFGGRQHAGNLLLHLQH
ncbi:hypothetical protein D3C73_1329970 [compost metagenome]